MKLSWTFTPLWEYLSGYVSGRAAVFHFVMSRGQILSERLGSAGTSRSDGEPTSARLGLFVDCCQWLQNATMLEQTEQPSTGTSPVFLCSDSSSK